MKQKFIIAFDIDRCKGCELCISMCPKQVLAIESNQLNRKGYHPAGVISAKQESCIGCLCCALICPDNVISVCEE